MKVNYQSPRLVFVVEVTVSEQYGSTKDGEYLRRGRDPGPDRFRFSSACIVRKSNKEKDSSLRTQLNTFNGTSKGNV